MKKLVILPGGYHPYHAGHKALYDATVAAFPRADVFVAATTDTSARPFPFPVKKFLAQQAGVPGNRFIQVKSPFRAEEITQMYDPEQTVLIFVRSTKDENKQPLPGGVKRDGTAAYLQPLRRNNLAPMSQHGYITYLPTVQFGPGMTSATEIRGKWPTMHAQEKIDLVRNMYPKTAGNERAAAKVVEIFDTVMSDDIREQLQGTALGGGAQGLQPGLGEATLINDPEQGHLIRPDGGMGTWDEDSLRSNLVRKFSDMLDMMRGREYGKLYQVLYRAGAVENMLQALQQYDAWRQKQGRRPVASGREINMADYVEEKKHSQ